MPKLDNLQINLTEEEEVVYVLRHLPELKYLNGIVVEPDAIYSEMESQESARLQNADQTLQANIGESITLEQTGNGATMSIDRTKRLSVSSDDFKSFIPEGVLKVEQNENF